MYNQPKNSIMDQLMKLPVKLIKSLIWSTWSFVRQLSCQRIVSLSLWLAVIRSSILYTGKYMAEKPLYMAAAVSYAVAGMPRWALYACWHCGCVHEWQCTAMGCRPSLMTAELHGVLTSHLAMHGVICIGSSASLAAHLHDGWWLVGTLGCQPVVCFSDDSVIRLLSSGVEYWW